MKMHLHQQPYPCNPYKRRRRGKGGGKLEQAHTSSDTSASKASPST